ncbi:MAG: hypothetical protein JWP69_1335 [Flaviaesturariibacter sp.]|nr:hypothetical protein [Flaviaesturariibacter sp.]
MRYIILFYLCLNFLSSSAQINTQVLQAGAGLGKNLLGGLQDKKKAKIIQASLSETEIDGNKITVLRVAEEKIISPVKGFIVRVQEQLDAYGALYKAAKHVDIPSYNDDIAFIKSSDKDWPVHYYEKELAAYKGYEKALNLQERRSKDSADLMARQEQKRISDSLTAIRQKQADSLVYAQRMEGYHFVAKESILLKEKPSEKSQTKGRVYKGSYVQIKGYSESTGYVKVTLEDVEGFMKRDELEDDLNKIQATQADLTTYKSRRYYKYEPNYDYAPAEQKTASATEVAPRSSSPKQSSSGKKVYSSARNYITGPRGGCYYLTSSGNKVYVDHSYCN